MKPTALAQRLGSSPRVEFLALVGLTLCWQGIFLWRTRFAIEGDEAILGLMARHISEGTNFPFWYYGQEYMGSLEAFLAAPLVAVFGSSTIVLKMVALAFAVVAVIASWLLARRVFGPGPTAFLTGAYLACGPLFLTLWSTKLRGGFVSTWALGASVLLLAHMEASDQARWYRSLGLGVVAGLATYQNFLVFPYLAAAFLFLFTTRTLFRVRRLPLYVGGYLLGASPLLYYNLAHRWVTFRTLLGSDPAENAALDHLLVFLRRGLPVMLGARTPWRDGSPFGALDAALIGVLALGFALLLWTRRASIVAALRLSPTARAGAEMYGVVAAGILAGLAFSKYGAQGEPRYATVLYTAIAPSLACLIVWLTRHGIAGKVAGGFVAVGLAATNATSTFGTDPRQVSQPLHYVEERVRLPLDFRPLAEGLAGAGIGALACDFWAANPLAYAASELAVPVFRWKPLMDRYRGAQDVALFYPAREGAGQASKEALASLQTSLGKGIWIWEGEGSFAVFLRNKGVPRDLWRVSASSPGAESAVDGRLNTQWTSAASQRPGQYLLIDLGQETEVRSALFVFGDRDEPAEAVLEAGVQLEQMAVVAEVRAPASLWAVSLPQPKARYLRLRSTGSAPRWLTVNEVALY